MAMFSFDEQAALFDVTPLPNQFILNYLPEASGDAVRVYLFGLVACYHHEAIRFAANGAGAEHDGG